MSRPSRPSLRILSCLLGLLLFAQLGLAGLVAAAQPQWVELCTASGTKYLPLGDAASASPGHDSGGHCPACPLGQAAALPAPPSPPVFRAAFAGPVLPTPAPLLRAASRWTAILPRAPPLFS
ncbi:DUF2946 family protein [Massilia agri]|uniref:DUF2946 family protein n=1 Tax=Massilia agri TaxID=1886785 RepID=UPI00351CDC19